MESSKYWLGFNMVPGIGPARISRLLEHFGDLERAWSATGTELKMSGLDTRAVTSLQERRSRIDLDGEMERLAHLGIKLLTWDDPAYPPRLKEIPDPPPVLHLRGTLAGDEWAVAVVGTRRATAYGRQATEQIVAELSRSHVTVVSGLARGIDSIAHRAALDAGGRTIAVLGNGLDIVYPAENVKLAQAIVERGALVSEHPLGVRPDAKNFHRRNRIMSGLTLGVLIMEAGETSGAHITVRHALEQNREVFAVPGSIFSPMSRGTNQWIQEGAKLVRDAEDILEELNLSMASQQLEMKQLLAENDTEARLLRHLSREPVHIDEVVRLSGLPISAVSSNLLTMELKGMIRQVGAMSYVRTRESGVDYEIRSN